MLSANGEDDVATTCAFSKNIAYLTEHPYTPFVEDCPIQENYDFLNIVRTDHLTCRGEGGSRVMVMVFCYVLMEYSS
jgi:hypothetical protein